VSLVSLVLVSLGTLLWFVTMPFTPKADWGASIGVARQVHFVEFWMKVGVHTLMVAFVLCFFGRARLITPIVIACVGATLANFPKDALDAPARAYDDVLANYALPAADVPRDGPHNQIESNSAAKTLEAASAS
jgi:hypothetical protein